MVHVSRTRWYTIPIFQRIVQCRQAVHKLLHDVDGAMHVEPVKVLVDDVFREVFALWKAEHELVPGHRRMEAEDACGG